MPLDPVDERIVGMLVDDARRSFAEIGATVGLSASAVKRRVDRMRADGAITGFTVRLDPGALGWTVEGYVELFCGARTPPATIRDAVRRFPEVVEASTVSGEADAVLRILAADMRHFEKVLEQISAAPFVVRTKSVLVLSPLLRRPGPPARPLTQRSRVRKRKYATDRRRPATPRDCRASHRRSYRGSISAPSPRPPGYPWSVPVTSVLSRPSAPRRAHRHPPPLPHVPARALRRDLRDQPLDAARRGRRRGARARPVGRAAPHLPRPRPPRRPPRPGAGPAGHGVRGQRRHRRRRRGVRRPLPLRRTRTRGRRPPRLVPRGGLRAGGRPGVRQRGRGRPARRGRGDPRRVGVPHRPARPRRGGAGAGPRGGAARAGRPALLPPRHGAGGARRDHHRLAPGGVLARVARGARRPLPARRARHGRRRRRARPQRRERRPPRRAARRGHRPRGRARRARLRPRPRRDVRAAEGRRRTQVLHVGGAPHDASSGDAPTDVPHPPGRGALRAQLPPAAGGGRARRRRLGHRRRGPPLPRLPRGLLGAQLRPPPPGPGRRGPPAAGPGDAHQPGVRQRPARPVLRGAVRAAAASRWCCR